MGNTWKGISTDQMHSSELTLLKLGGVDLSRVKISDVNLTIPQDPFYSSENYIHYIEILPKQSDPHAETLLITHGYGVGAASYFRALADLSAHFHIIAFDLMGMGCSGRPPFACSTTEEAEEFFLEPMRRFVVKLGLQRKYVLVGHSLGAYLMAIYAMRYALEVKRLVLLSPVGVPERPKELTDEQQLNAYYNTRMKRLGGKIFAYFWARDITVFQVLRITGRFGASNIMKIGMKRRLDTVNSTQEEFEALLAYLHQISLRPGSGEFSFNTILSVGAWARKPLEHRIGKLTELGVPMHFVYGAQDEMDPCVPKQMLKNNIIKGDLFIIDNCNHNLLYNKPKECVYYVIRAVHGQNAADAYLESNNLSSI